MKKRSATRYILLSASILAAAAPLPAMAANTGQSAAGSSLITVTVPDVIILDYYTKINLNIAGTASGELQDNGTLSLDGSISNSTMSGNGLSTVKTSAMSALNGSAPTFTASNAWAVRGFSATGKAKVTLSGLSELTNSSSSIQVKNLKAMVGATDAGDTNGITIAGITPTYGDIQMGLDFSKAKLSGDYTGTLTITASTM